MQCTPAWTTDHYQEAHKASQGVSIQSTGAKKCYGAANLKVEPHC